jgi:hypothetical protein
MEFLHEYIPVVRSKGFLYCDDTHRGHDAGEAHSQKKEKQLLTRHGSVPYMRE